ncbi:CD1375 family protein [Paenibacillus crassostreae]|nr:CD1375 family protein [Paenibacillus crassostreae]
MDKTAIAKAYFELVKAGRRTEESVPDSIRTEYELLKEADLLAQ